MVSNPNYISGSNWFSFWWHVPDGVEIKAKPTDTLKLGEKKTFEAIMGGQPIKVKWTTHAIDQPPAGSLFPNDIGVFFDPGTDSSEKEFQTVHLGEVELIAYDPTTLKQLAAKKIKVEKPSKLGTTNNQYDSEIIDAADKIGIPPQYIKGHIEKESDGFKLDSFRYEPGIDLQQVQPNKDKTNYLYKQHLLAENATMPDTLDNKSLRDKYSYDAQWTFPPASWDPKQQPPVINEPKIVVDYVTCANIFYRNDKRNVHENWTPPIGILNPGTTTDWTNKNIDYKIINLHTHWVDKETDFVAQTIIASSYGLLQMMYAHAVNEGGFSVSNDPYDLASSVTINLDIARRMYAVRFPKEVTRTNIKSPDGTPAPPLTQPIYYPNNYANEEQWKEEWINFFQKWNPGEVARNANRFITDPLKYGKKVVSNATAYVPK